MHYCRFTTMFEDAGPVYIKCCLPSPDIICSKGKLHIYGCILHHCNETIAMWIYASLLKEFMVMHKYPIFFSTIHLEPRHFVISYGAPHGLSWSTRFPLPFVKFEVLHPKICSYSFIIMAIQTHGQHCLHNLFTYFTKCWEIYPCNWTCMIVGR